MNTNMREIPSAAEIKKFWEWFVSVCPSLEGNDKDQDLIKLLDGKLRKLGVRAWEIGPGFFNPKLNAFVISPGGEKDHLEATKRIVNEAPKCPGWEFHPAKPPKEWYRRFNMKTQSGEMVEIDASGWRYGLFKFPDGSFDIVIKAPNILDLTEDEQFWAAGIVLDSELGEEKSMKLIETIEVVAEFEGELCQNNSSIEVLAKSIAELQNDTPGSP